MPNRFLRVPASSGVELVSSSALFKTNPDEGDRIADRGFGDKYKGRVQPGCILIARSGQTYGLVGSVAMATLAHKDKVVSDHVIRLAPNKDCNMRAGYVMVALSHPILGRPLMKALPTGSSIPSIDFKDVLDLTLPRFLDEQEIQISNLATRATELQAQADAREIMLAASADEVVSKLLMPHQIR